MEEEEEEKEENIERINIRDYSDKIKIGNIILPNVRNNAFKKMYVHNKLYIRFSVFFFFIPRLDIIRS